MSNKVNGLWAVNSDGVFMFFNSVDSPSVWRFGMSDNVESWRMVPGVVNAQAVRGVAAAYRADGGVWLDPNGADYAQAVREIGDVPSIVERGGLIASDDCGDYSAHGLSLPDVDRERGWVLSWEHGGMVVSRDVSLLTPMEQDHPEMCETYDDLPVVEPVAPVAQSVEVVEPEPEPAETVPQTQQPMSELGGHTIAEFKREFDRIYGVLYDADGSGHSIDYGRDIDAFDNHEYPRVFLRRSTIIVRILFRLIVSLRRLSARCVLSPRLNRLRLRLWSLSLSRLRFPRFHHGRNRMRLSGLPARSLCARW